MAPTPFLTQLPYVRRLLAALDSVIGRTRLMRIEEEGELTSHIDTNYYWRDHVRVHLPVRTTPDVEFECDGELVHMAAGEAWVFDTWRPHRVVNPSHTPRIHLVVDTVGSASLWGRIDHPDPTTLAIPVDGPEPRLVTERVNQPLVMTPWELEHALDLLLRELDGSDPAVAAALRAPVLQLERAWRSAWARFGDASDGWDHFAALRDDGRRRGRGRRRRRSTAERCAGGGGDPSARAPRPRSTRTASPAGRVAPRVPSPTIDDPVIDRPVFVVSSPRSGSTLLFETLARARGLFTVGGESHRVIESVPGLHPRSHDWSSNRLRRVRCHAADRRRAPARASPRSCATATGTRRRPARYGSWRRRRRTRCGCRSSLRCSPTPASSTCTGIPARRSAACSTRGGRAASSPTPTCPGGASRRGRSCSSPDGGSSSAGRWREIVATQWATATDGAARRPRAARSRPVVRHQLRRHRARRAVRDGTPRCVLRRRVGRHARGRAPAGAPHPRLTRSRQVAPQRRRARPALGPGPRGRGACPRCVRLTAPRRARAPVDTAPLRRPPPPRPRLPTPSTACTPPPSRRCSPPPARRCWSRRTRAAASSSSATTVRSSTPTSGSSRSRWASPRARRARRREQDAAPALPEPTRVERPPRSPRCARRLLRPAVRAPSPATSASTTWRSPATSCGR